MNEHIPKEIPKEVLVDNLILLGYRGSIAHNMYIPNTDPNSIDDIDIIGVFIAPENFYIGLGQHRSSQTKEISKEINGVMWDCVYYELRKFIKLLLKGNPNVLSLLWIKPEHYLLINEFGKMLLENRESFLGKKALYTSFTGYANGQLKRMTHFKTKGYMGEKRKRLVDKYGYDTKNAAHLIRLLTMGIEILNTNTPKIFRDKDANMLLDIKTGKWSLKEVKDLAKKLFKDAKEAYTKSTLPNEPDYFRAEEVTMSILNDYLIRRKIP
jgi:predicted nucleotidyltransferase